jgi:hypothetical protein
MIDTPPPRSILRGILNLASAGSLLLALAVAVLWVRSYLVHDAALLRWRGRLVGVDSTAGQFVVADDVARAGRRAPAVRWRSEGFVVPYGASVPLALVRVQVNRVANGRLWVFPQWPLVAAAALPPALGVVRRRRRRARAVPGACRNCEYDLTGNVSGVCPECGTQV